MPDANAPNADDTASVGDPSHSASPTTRATPHAPRTAMSGVSAVRSTRIPARAVSRSARPQLMPPLRTCRRRHAHGRRGNGPRPRRPRAYRARGCGQSWRGKPRLMPPLSAGSGQRVVMTLPRV